MADDTFDSPDDIEGVNHAKSALDVERTASDREIEAAFERNSRGADGEEFWTYLKAREIALPDSVYEGIAVYKMLRESPVPEDITSLLAAEELLEVSPPPNDQFNSHHYGRGVLRTREYARSRLEEIDEEGDLNVDPHNVRALDVACYALYFQDVQRGRRHVLGDETASGGASATGDESAGDWRYSVDRSGERECYRSPGTDVAITVEPAQDDPRGGYAVTLQRDGEEISSERHARYGDAKREVKRWILER